LLYMPTDRGVNGVCVRTFAMHIPNHRPMIIRANICATWLQFSAAKATFQTKQA
jgi:hypothetical protein